MSNYTGLNRVQFRRGLILLSPMTLSTILDLGGLYCLKSYNIIGWDYSDNIVK